LVSRNAAAEAIREENQIALKVSELSTKHAPQQRVEVLRGLGEARAKTPAKRLHEIREAKTVVLAVRGNEIQI
jgi:hypothetical protein